MSTTEEIASLTTPSGEFAERNLRELETYVTSRPGEDLVVPVGIEDIGGELVSIASEGLYSDPRDALREFCQNGVDAKASKITIRFTGLNVAVIDDGVGMSFEDLLLARRFGRSSKSAATNVGFRGIGIYSGFQICERLIIVSHQAGSDKRWTMTFDFAAMRRTLDEKTGGDRGLETALGPLIQSNTTIGFDKLSISEIPTSGSTIALLENIDPEAYTELSDLESLKGYLRRTLPVPFADSFEYKSKIERYLSRNVPLYKTVAVRLTNDDTAFDEEISRSFPTNLEPPRFLEASWPPGAPVARAFIWTCMSKRTTLRKDGGIYFKKRGFTIGDGSELREKFLRRPAVYDWYAGEVYVVDETVIPNAARNGFEKNAGFRNLWSSLDEPTSILLKEADDFSKRERAAQVVGDVESEFQELIGTVSESTDMSKTVTTLEKIQRMYGRLEGQKIPVKDASYNRVRSKKTFLVNLIDQERSRLRELIERPRSPEPQASTEVRSTTFPTHGGQSSFEASSSKTVQLSEKSPTNSIKALIEVFQAYGWPIGDELRLGIALIESAFLKSMGSRTSEPYSEFLKALAALLDEAPRP